MKTHSASEPGRPRGPAPGLRLLPRAAWIIAAFAALCVAGGVRAQTFDPEISQVIATEDNNVYFDHNGDTPAVIILKNNGVVTGTLNNWALTDNPAEPRKWVFSSPVAIVLPAGETLVVFASGLDRQSPPFATNFLLPCGSTAYLFNPQASVPTSQMAVVGSECPDCLPVFSRNTTSAWIVPSANNPAGTAGDWRLPSFQDASWSRGQLCLGYDSDPLMANMILYSVFDTGTVDTVNRTITDVSGPTLHTGTWPLWTGAAGGSNIGIPLASLPKVIENVGFAGPNNTNSYVQYAHHAELDPGAGSYTWSIWVRPLADVLTSNEVILRKGMDSPTSNAGYTLTRATNLSGVFSLLSPGFATVTATLPANTLTRDVWHHITAVVSRGSTNSLTLYHNGVLRDTKAIVSGFAVNTSLPLYLARAISGVAVMYFGRMDDFVTWNRALTPAEITRVHDAGNAGKRVDDPSAPGGQAPIFAPCIQTDVQTAMKGVNTSLYERLPFSIPNPAAVSAMTFKVKYADGFIAYINGVEIARRNAPTGVPLWNSAATADRPDASAIVVEEIPVPAAAISALLPAPGENILAIHALNFTVNENRFLICPDLCYQEEVVGDCYVTTSGKNFWITFPGNAPEEISNPLKLSICITGSAGTIGTVSIPGLAFTQNFVLPPGGKITIALPKAASLDKSDTIENKGVHIIADKNVAVYGKTRIDYSTDTFLAHQYETLGSSYIVLGWGNKWPYPELNGSQFGLVATADNTHITVKPTATTGSHTAGVPYNFILNAGQTYLLRNTTDTADLTGTEITSDAPIAVFGGHRCANVNGEVFFCDTVLEQTLPVALWNTEYCVAPLATRTSGTELVRVVAAENGTTIFINGAPQAPVLNKGEKQNYTVAGGAAISADKKFLAAHLSRSSDADDVTDADPFQINAQPTASWLAGYKFCTAPAVEFGAHYANIFARNAELAGVVVNPAPLAAGPITPIGGTPYSYRQVTLAAGTTYTSSGRTHGIEIYGWDEFDSYGHTGGMGFNDTFPPTFVQCPPDITIFTSQQPGGGEVASVPDLGKQFGVTDNCCPETSIAVTQTPRPGSLLPAGDYQVIISATDCNKNTVTCVVNLHVRTDPRATAFPTAFGIPALEATVWGWTADPDGDGLTNEQEDALGTNMAVAVAGDLSAAFSFRHIMFGGMEGIEVSYRKRNNNPSYDYSPEGSAELTGWFGGLGHFEETSITPDALAGFNRVRAFSHDSVNLRRFYLRLHIRRN